MKSGVSSVNLLLEQSQLHNLDGQRLCQSVVTRMSLRLGIDVGGTNTDAVLIDGDNVIGCAKQFTSKDVLSGINSAVRSVIAGSRAGRITLTRLLF